MFVLQASRDGFKAENSRIVGLLDAERTLSIVICFVKGCRGEPVVESGETASGCRADAHSVKPSISLKCYLSKGAGANRLGYGRVLPNQV